MKDAEEDEGRIKERREDGKKEIALSRHWTAAAPRESPSQSIREENCNFPQPPTISIDVSSFDKI